MGGIELRGSAVPRLAEDRPPAEPSSRDQKDRYDRILRAAARHGAEKGLERVQMLDVARDAAHNVMRPGAPIATFMVGYAAATRGGGPEAIAAAGEAVSAAALAWPQGTPE